MLLALLWAVALGWFVATLPHTPLAASQKTGAIVVLTGGQGRVDRGFELLAEGAAPILFISGVGADATEDELLNAYASAATREAIYERGGEILLDHVARSTVSNAEQTVQFLRSRNITSIRLVTASYHMRRSTHEFKGAAPELVIHADPVFPEGYQRDAWWQHPNSRRLVFSEFYKYFAILVRDALRPESTADSAQSS